MLLVILLVISYLFGINFYAYLLIRGARKKQSFSSESAGDDAAPTESELVRKAEKQKRRKDALQLLIAGALGGAITVYTCMFVFKHKLKDLLLMTVMPMLCVLNLYAVFTLVRTALLRGWF